MPGEHGRWGLDCSKREQISVSAICKCDADITVDQQYPQKKTWSMHATQTKHFSEVRTTTFHLLLHLQTQDTSRFRVYFKLTKPDYTTV